MSDTDHPYEIAVCKASGLAPELIQWATRGPYVHTYIIGKTDTVSMEPGGLVHRPHDYWGPNNPTSRLQLTDEQKVKWDAFLVQHAGARYDYAGDLVVGLDDVTPSWQDPFWHRLEHLEAVLLPGFWFCSSFADALVTATGIQLFTDRRPTRGVTPMDIYRRFRVKGWA